MSWSISVPLTDAEHVNEAIDAAPLQGMYSAEHAEQVAAAKEAAKRLIASGALGPFDGRTFAVSLSGHANAGHQPLSGWADDMTHLTVSSKPASVSE